MRLRFPVIAAGLFFISNIVLGQVVHSSAEPGSQPRIAVVAMLNRDWNAKKLKAGDKLSSEVIQDVVVKGKILIPRNSKIIGHVVRVEPLAEPQGESRLTLTFDSGRLKHGQALNFHGFVEAIGPPILDPLLETELTTFTRYDSHQMGRPDSGSAGSANITSEPTLDPPQDSTVRALKESQRALDNARKIESPETARTGALSSRSRGVFGFSGLFLSNRSETSTIIAVGRNIDLKSGSQIVVSLDLTQNPSTSGANPY